ncbi:uncharacterized protein TNCV_3662091 [Trichonephila clavipes]|nr:uncharacterized protein TNCV_3662091 [Trichonephila clavipes]
MAYHHIMSEEDRTRDLWFRKHVTYHWTKMITSVRRLLLAYTDTICLLYVLISTPYYPVDGEPQCKSSQYLSKIRYPLISDNECFFLSIWHLRIDRFRQTEKHRQFKKSVAKKKEYGEKDQILSSINHKESNIVNFIKIQRIKWAGHVVRMDENRTTKKVFNAQPIRTQRKGRPNLRWIDGLEKRSPSFEN